MNTHNLNAVAVVTEFMAANGLEIDSLLLRAYPNGRVEICTGKFNGHGRFDPIEDGDKIIQHYEKYKLNDHRLLLTQLTFGIDSFIIESNE